jgi:hypothetical protein
MEANSFVAPNFSSRFEEKVAFRCLKDDGLKRGLAGRRIVLLLSYPRRAAC